MTPPLDRPPGVGPQIVHNHLVYNHLFTELTPGTQVETQGGGNITVSVRASVCWDSTPPRPSPPCPLNVAARRPAHPA